MNLEVQFFKEQILKFSSLENLNYSFIKEEVFNEDSKDSEFYRVTFHNKNQSKSVVFTFYPSNFKLTKNEIEVYITYNDRSIDFPTFLAYKELKREIRYEDLISYRFKVDPKAFENSVIMQLEKIRFILNTELIRILTTNEWINIPIHDPRDDY